MNSELISAVVGAVLVAWAAYSALRATWSATRMRLLGGLIAAAAFVLLIRLISSFGGWTDWFVYAWLAAMVVCAAAVFRTVLVWPDLPWRAAEAKARRAEVATIGIESVLTLLIAGALVIPGLMLG